ncbi:hypothetical protein CCE28_01300 [Anaeromicrobium sediminis]|uniref:Uncharacterized protein n=2 Tax=Anaeromicrobium sediminis TaxID=1478221 RepID=A0A267MQN9_9FIRM|nr:hypothetical protein CCE28_01300 [Anaeromicrobium sediminis]
MNYNKKGIISILLITLVLSIPGCSKESNNKAEESVSIKTVTNLQKNSIASNNSNIYVDEDIKREYNDLIGFWEEYIEKLPDEIKDHEIKAALEKIKKNIPIMMELNQQAKNSCSKGYSVESNIYNSTEKKLKRYVRFFFYNGNYREEEYENDKLVYLTIYSKGEDTLYSTTRGIIKNYRKEIRGSYPYMNGYFITTNNSILGDMKYIDYEGRKVLYSEGTFERMDVYNSPTKYISRYWYDVETGIIIKEEFQSFTNNKLESTYGCDYTIKFNQSFDKDIFIYDENTLHK